MVQLWQLKPTVYGIRHVLLQSETVSYFYFGTHIVFSYLDGDWTVVSRWLAGLERWFGASGSTAQVVLGRILPQLWLANA